MVSPPTKTRSHCIRRRWQRLFGGLCAQLLFDGAIALAAEPTTTYMSPTTPTVWNETDDEAPSWTVLPQWRSATRTDATDSADTLDSISRYAQRTAPAPKSDRNNERDADTADDVPSKTKTAPQETEPSRDKPLPSWAPALAVGEVPFDASVFSPLPDYQDVPYTPATEIDVYDGKYLNPTERPWVELGRGLYLPGKTPCSQTFLGDHNLVAQHFLVYGDYRMGSAYFDNGVTDKVVSAARLNLDFDWKLTGTERIHGFWGPLDRGANFTRWEIDHGRSDLIDELDSNWDTIYFEGDVGSILGGWGGYDSRFDLPFAAGLMPLLFHNGIWMEDAFVGTAATLPARHCSALGWSNFDVTFFSGFDKLNSPAFGNDDSAAHAYGVISFIEAYSGYFEVGYAYLDDVRNLGRSYHNVMASWTRRYWQRLSNSVRVVVNAGQDPIVGPQTADGCLLLVESALVSAQPNTVVPYVNVFAGLGRTQSVARAANAGGILHNTGILFETDGLTGFPTLDDTGTNACGGALGLNWLAADFSHQVVLEMGTVQTFGSRVGAKAADDQYGLGARYQLPLNQAWILRMDALYGLQVHADDLAGGRVELRYKF